MALTKRRDRTRVINARVALAVVALASLLTACTSEPDKRDESTRSTSETPATSAIDTEVHPPGIAVREISFSTGGIDSDPSGIFLVWGIAVAALDDAEVRLHAVDLGRSKGLLATAFVVTPDATIGSHGGTGYGPAGAQLDLLGAESLNELPSAEGVPLATREPVFDGFESSIALELSLDDGATVGRSSSLLVDYSIDGDRRVLEVPTGFLACKLATDDAGKPMSGLETPWCLDAQQKAMDEMASVPSQVRLQEVS